MYKELIYHTESIEKNAISLAEKRIGKIFPNAFIDFCLKYNGAKLKDAEINVTNSNNNQNSYGVNEFIQVEKIDDLDIEYWDENLIAFAEDSSGNFFVFKKNEMKAVYFWDHETNLVEMVSETFEIFLKDISEADYDDLPEPQNAKVWVDPNFLKKQKDLGNA